MKTQLTGVLVRTLFFSMATGLAGCGGLAFINEETACQGPYCTQTCTVSSECPADSNCRNGRCDQYVPGGGDGSQGDPGGGDDGDSILTDGNPFEDIDPTPCTVSSPEVCDGYDNDCDGLVDTADPNLVTGPEFCDGIDNDCNGLYDYADTGHVCKDAGGGAVACGGVTETVCDGIDDNCDGAVDEGVTNPCGTCAGYPSCYTGQPPYCDSNLAAGAAGACAPTSGGGGDRGTLPVPDPTSSTDPDTDTVQQQGSDTNNDGLGAVTLQSGTSATDFAWPASETLGTVSRVDTIANIEVARYASVLKLPTDPRRPYVADYDFTPNTAPRTACQEPSRSTVDQVGNAYIANRAVNGYTGKCDNENNGPNQMGSVTKVGYYDPTFCNSARNPGLAGCECVDRNGNGYIETSHDYDFPANGIQVSTANVSKPWQSCDNYDGGTTDCLTVTATDCVGSRCGTACETDASCRVPCNSPSDCGGAACNADSTGDKFCDDGATHYYCVYDSTPTPVGGVTHKQRCSSSPTLPEFLGRNDECVVWTRRIPRADNSGSTSGTNAITSANKNNDSADPGGAPVFRSVPRAMAIDKAGYIWVGAHYAQQGFKLDTNGNFRYPADPDAGGPITVNSICPVTLRKVSDGTTVATYSYDPTTGAQTITGDPSPCASGTDCVEAIPSNCRIGTSSMSPYGAVIDSGRSDGAIINPHPAYLYFTNTNGNLRKIDTTTGTVTSPPNGNAAASLAAAYGITIDHRDRPWTPDSGGRSRVYIHRYMPATNSWASFSPSACVGDACATTCTADTDCSGQDTNHNVCSADLSTGPGTNYRGCTLKCGAQAACDSEAPGTTCTGGRCTWDTHDNWKGRGATTELVSIQSQPALPAALVANCDEQGATAPCSRVWAVFNNDWTGTPNWIFAFDADSGKEIVSLRRRIDINSSLVSGICTGPVGAGIGIGGIVWTVDQDSDVMCGYDPKPGSSINPANPATNPMAQVPIDVHPYTYSDFTGNIFRSFTNPNGFYRVVIAGCPTGFGPVWKAVTWDADTPGDSKLQVRFRFASSAIQTANPSILQEPIPPVISQGATPILRYDFPPPDRIQPFVQVEFNFVADDQGAVPTLYHVDAIRQCLPIE